MNNPLSDDPRWDLAPFPHGSSGHRLWGMLSEVTSRHGPGGHGSGISRRDYMDAFDRHNLLHARRWNMQEARAAALVLIPRMQGREVVVLGADTAAALGLPRLLLHPQTVWGVRWRQLPHPSGRNPWYNVPVHRDITGLLLEELCVRGGFTPSPDPATLISSGEPQEDTHAGRTG